MRILLAGATGAIGRWLIRCLKEDSHSMAISNLARTKSRHSKSPVPQSIALRFSACRESILTAMIKSFR